MAGMATPEENKSLDAEPPNPLQAEIAARADAKEKKAAQEVRLRKTAAKLYGQGFSRVHIAEMMVDHLVRNEGKALAVRRRNARFKLAKWEKDQEFRDLIYNLAVVKLDLQTPAILGGVARKAKRGRVDAARLALEITGRHNPKGEQAATQVAIVFSGVPRPDSAKAVQAIEMQVLEEED